MRRAAAKIWLGDRRESIHDSAPVPMELIPAIDLLDGQVVRLSQGEFGTQTAYGEDPVAVARRWAAEGAARLHLVDLDGAREGRPVQHGAIGRVIAGTGVPCGIAGGIRTADAVKLALALGADRVVMGTALLRDPELARRLIAEHGPDTILAAIDVRGDDAVGSGWVAQGVAKPMDEALGQLLEGGVEHFVVTAIARDGLQEGPDLDLLGRAAAIVGAERVIASGGVTTIDDIRRLAAAGYSGAILGRALYEGTLTLREALAAAS